LNRAAAATSVVAVCLLAIVAPAHAAFQLVGQANGAGRWITRGPNSTWEFSTGSPGWTVTDDAFNTMATNVGPASRGLDWDPVHARMIVALADFSGVVTFLNFDGDVTGSFNTGSIDLNDVAVDPVDGTWWTAHFGGTVTHYAATGGSPLSSFVAPFTLSGITVDPYSQSLILMRADGPGGAHGPLDDEVWEFKYDGSNPTLLIPASTFPGTNALGVEYIPETRRLYTSGQLDDRVQIFEDLARIPEPTGLALLTLPLVPIVCRR
jgi:hypothetical protein